MTAPRTALAATPLPEQRHGSRLRTRDAFIGALGPDLDPFLMVSLYEMRGPTFPPHPHAGFMVATYILPESEVGFVNQDSLGTHNRIPPGALHVTLAGRGVLHEEQPEVEGLLAQGFQIWIDLPAALRESAPQALHLPAEAVPAVASPGVDVRVVLGAHQGLAAPLTLPTPVTLLDVTLAPGARWTHALAASEHAFAFVLGGGVSLGPVGAVAGQLLRTRAEGEALTLQAGHEGARFTLFAGTPLRQPRAMQGPFVANDAHQLARFARDHASGRFGSLTPMGAA